MLLEALIGLVIFAVGILAVIGLQALAMQGLANADFRTDAAMLANELIGKLWTDSKNLTTLQTTYNSPGGTYFATWRANVASTLPGVSATANAPTVAVAPVVAASGLSAIQVAVTVRWQAPGEGAHSYTTLTQLNCTVTDALGTACSW